MRDQIERVPVISCPSHITSPQGASRQCILGIRIANLWGRILIVERPSGDYRRFLADHNILSTMNVVGHCADNTAAEGFLGMSKRERSHRQRYPTLVEA